MEHIMKRMDRKLLALGFAVYLYILIKIILFKYAPVEIAFLLRQLHSVMEHPEIIENGLAYANFTPFFSIHQNLDHLSNTHDFVNLFGNIALFVPLGIFTRLSAKGGLFTALVLSLGISFSLEGSQLLLSMGSFDVDDLILNVLGGLIGYAICLVVPQPAAAFQKKS
ncbi:VanZ family protein [Paenibacillus jilunlii]|nr:VanZ family protein [Paenibacillus jilunlii]